MTDYPGTYRARCVSVKGDKITAYVPQVFGDERITITSRTGGLPDPNSNGWVMFESAQASLPVWQSAQGSQSVSSASEGSTDPDVIYWPLPAGFYSFQTITPLPDSWIGHQVRISVLMLVINHSAAQVHYTGTMEDPENPGNYITPPDEEVPWLPESQYVIPTAAFSLNPDQSLPDEVTSGTFEDLPNYVEVSIEYSDLVANTAHWVPFNTTEHEGSLHVLILGQNLSMDSLVNPPEVSYPDVDHSIQPFAVPAGTVRYERL